MDSPLSVGQIAAIAGRSIPAMVRRLNLAIAISAPVLPADTATSASPFFTASMASHIDDFQRPLRSAWLGLSSILTATSVCTTPRGGLEPRTGVEQRVDHGAVAEQEELDVGMSAERELGARNDHRGPMVSPHGVERDADFLGHGCDNTVLSRRAAPVRQQAADIPLFRQLATSSGPFSPSPFFSAASAANGCPAASPAAGASNTAPGLRG